MLKYVTLALAVSMSILTVVARCYGDAQKQCKAANSGATVTVQCTGYTATVTDYTHPAGYVNGMTHIEYNMDGYWREYHNVEEMCCVSDTITDPCWGTGTRQYTDCNIYNVDQPLKNTNC